ncbi:MAG: phage holin family protein [Thermoanaerobaculia bacterium]
MIGSSMEPEEELREAPDGTWRQWKGSVASFARALGSLGSLRWEMAKAEAKDWGRFALLRVALIAGAVALSFLALVFLLVGLVLLLASWLGSLLGAVFVCFGICLVSAITLVLAATRGRLSRPIFERTAAEIRKDLGSWTGEEP